MKKVNVYKIVIADPSPVFSDGLERLLNADPECTVVGCFTNYDSLIDKVWRLNPDVILFNPVIISSHKRFFIRHILKDCGESVMIAILYSYVTSDILSDFDECIDIFDSPQKIIQKIKSAIKKTDFEHQQERNTGDVVELSDREIEILVSVAQGLTNKEIAEKHNISTHTVISHRKNISRKTNIRTVSGLTVYAMLNNLMP
jgi:Response regulator containing a CheY-like receiver domain and an HTH DNA-binding domain